MVFWAEPVPTCDLDVLVIFLEDAGKSALRRLREKVDLREKVRIVL